MRLCGQSWLCGPIVTSHCLRCQPDADAAGISSLGIFYLALSVSCSYFRTLSGITHHFDGLSWLFDV